MHATFFSFFLFHHLFQSLWMHSHCIYSIRSTQSAAPPETDQRLQRFLSFRIYHFSHFDVRLLWKFTYEWIDRLIFFLCVCIRLHRLMPVVGCRNVVTLVYYAISEFRCLYPTNVVVVTFFSFFFLPCFFTYSLSHLYWKSQKLMSWVMPLVHAMHSIINGWKKKSLFNDKMNHEERNPNANGLILVFVYLFYIVRSQSFISSFGLIVIPSWSSQFKSLLKRVQRSVSRILTLISQFFVEPTFQWSNRFFWLNIFNHTYIRNTATINYFIGLRYNENGLTGCRCPCCDVV